MIKEPTRIELIQFYAKQKLFLKLFIKLSDRKYRLENYPGSKT